MGRFFSVVESLRFVRCVADLSVVESFLRKQGPRGGREVMRGGTAPFPARLYCGRPIHKCECWPVIVENREIGDDVKRSELTRLQATMQVEIEQINSV